MTSKISPLCFLCKNPIQGGYHIVSHCDAIDMYHKECFELVKDSEQTYDRDCQCYSVLSNRSRGDGDRKGIYKVSYGSTSTFVSCSERCAKKARSLAISPTCLTCGLKKEKMFLCSKCKNAKYCSVECQRVDWKKIHRSVCDKYHVPENPHNKNGDEQCQKCGILDGTDKVDKMKVYSYYRKPKKTKLLIRALCADCLEREKIYCMYCGIICADKKEYQACEGTCKFYVVTCSQKCRDAFARDPVLGSAGILTINPGMHC